MNDSYYRYITPEVIRSGEIVADNAEANAEAERYNSEMSLGLMKKGKWLKAADFFGTVNVISFLMAVCVALKPVIVGTDAGINLAAAIIAGFGYAYLILRYILKSSLMMKFDLTRAQGRGRGYGIVAYPNSQNAQDIDMSLVLAFLCGLIGVVLGVVYLRQTCTFNKAVTFAAVVFQLAAIIFYVLSPKRYSVGISVIVGLLPVAASPVTIPYAAMSVFGAVVTHMRFSAMAQCSGYPDFEPLRIRYSSDGALKVTNYDNFNRFDGIDDEMESI